MKVRNDNSKKTFRGYIQNDTTKNKADRSSEPEFAEIKKRFSKKPDYFYLKLYEDHEQKKTQFVNKDNKEIKDVPSRDRTEHLSCLKEFDLLLLSLEELQT